MQMLFSQLKLMTWGGKGRPVAQFEDQTHF